ncbi:MAG: hypothetical protein EON93_06135 [Burkholderiales bacterium]|nr:MAG: hypothetical protein EON93_06135 [Burkholderiales bacterium]
MKFFSLILVTTALACAVVACDSRPRRADCIVMARITSPLDDRVPNEWLRRILPSAKELDVPLAGYSVQGKDVYLQFASRCSERKLLAESVLARANLTLSEPIKLDRIEPGPNTSDISGHHWRD